MKEGDKCTSDGYRVAGYSDASQSLKRESQYSAPASRGKHCSRVVSMLLPVMKLVLVGNFCLLMMPASQFVNSFFEKIERPRSYPRFSTSCWFSATASSTELATPTPTSLIQMNAALHQHRLLQQILIFRHKIWPRALGSPLRKLEACWHTSRSSLSSDRARKCSNATKRHSRP